MTFTVCNETGNMWPLEKYARWDGKCWHQIDGEDSHLRLLVEVIIKKIM
jgi:hypothetical protein